MVEDRRALKSRLSWKMTIVAIIITQGRPLNPKTLAGAAEAPAQLDLSRGPWNNGNNCKSLEDTGRRSHPVIAPLTASLDLSNVLAIWEASADTPGFGIRTLRQGIRDDVEFCTSTASSGYNVYCSSGCISMRGCDNRTRAALPHHTYLKAGRSSITMFARFEAIKPLISAYTVQLAASA